MKNPNKYFALKFTLTIILTIALLVTLIQESTAAIFIISNLEQIEKMETVSVSIETTHKDNYLLFDNILQNKYETLITSNIDYNTIYDTIEL